MLSPYFSRLAAPALLLGLALPLAAAGPQDRSRLEEPVYRVPRALVVPTAAEAPADDAVATPDAVATADTGAVAKPAEHPLMPAIRLAKNALVNIDANIKDYSCTLVKRESINGVPGEYEYVFTKVRHQPFSVYMYFLGPAHVKGRECIYVAGSNKNKLIAHEGGRKRFLPTVKIDPNGALAMRGQRYPITEVGLRTLTRRLVEVAENDAKFGECEVNFFKGAKINGRVCTCVQVVHPERRKSFIFHKARIFIDDENQIPVRYEAYDWPSKPGDKPPLHEEYTYMNVKLNVGLTDADFNERNPNYRFVRR